MCVEAFPTELHLTSLNVYIMRNNRNVKKKGVFFLKNGHKLRESQFVPASKKKGCLQPFHFKFNPAWGLLMDKILFRRKMLQQNCWIPV